MNIKRTIEICSSCKETRNAIKRVVDEVKITMFVELYIKVGNKEGEKELHKMVLAGDNIFKDFGQIECIKNGISKTFLEN